jgi:hypothetical protein
VHGIRDPKRGINKIDYSQRQALREKCKRAWKLPKESNQETWTERDLLSWSHVQIVAKQSRACQWHISQRLPSSRAKPTTELMLRRTTSREKTHWFKLRPLNSYKTRINQVNLELTVKVENIYIIKLNTRLVVIKAKDYITKEVNQEAWNKWKEKNM